MEPARQVRVNVDQDEARRLGVSSRSLAAALNAAVTGSTVTQLRDDIYLVNVVARATDDQRVSFEALSSIQVPTPSGRMVPLRQFATFAEEQEFPLVWRRDRVPTLTVRADVSHGVLPDAVVGALAPKVAEFAAKLPKPLPGRDRRPVRGKRDVQRVGVRRRAADDRADAGDDDAAAGELPPARDGGGASAARPDRRRR